MADTTLLAAFAVFLLWLALIWYCFVYGVALFGSIIIFRRRDPSSGLEERRNCTEGVTILRPLKGIDTDMELCLESSFHQVYTGPFEIIFCVEREGDAAIAVAESLIRRYPDVNARVLVSPEPEKYGANPKINNLAKGFVAAKYDIIWVQDSNTWVAPGTLQRSADRIVLDGARVVHHLPMSVSLDSGWRTGSALDEMFMLTAHAKMYSAINALAVDACVMGKSNMYRRSVIDAAVAHKLSQQSTSSQIDPSNRNKFSSKGHGIRHFAQYIAEDNMIAQCIWNHAISQGVKRSNITALTSDSVVQPLSGFSVKGYCDRRIRWLRVRRFMVYVATLIEPTTECFVAGVIGSLLVRTVFGVSPFLWFLLHITTWCAIDWFTFHRLMEFRNMDQVPGFVVLDANKRRARFSHWLKTWLLREGLALPIWVVAMCGYTIYWRNRPFKILPDMSTVEIHQ
ncbi:hypothetical protein DV451_002334 [Geotrichum candidum]|uniref:Ceramide glucosyltransferase n=1 Tax=Geotrichum candidum TaxID=1173061 RepID=A0A9P5KUL5_GEOCN|nr:hypothetical protein DV451_002334 [Geotrichum candidum]